jgi:ribA/ribD-fused uncharacterized protein
VSETPAVIDSFRGEFDFLSNFHLCRVEFDGLVYPSVEHAFQAAKSHDPAVRREIRAAGSCGKAKSLGRRCELGPDWEAVELGVMEQWLRSKFSDPVLREKLLATGEARLEEGNTWNDTFWGVCRGHGKNRLGKLLMRVRQDLRSTESRVQNAEG